MSTAASLSRTPDEVLPPPRRAWPITVLAMILLIAAGVRWYRIGAAPYWQDELCTLETVSGRGLMRGMFPRNTLIDHVPDVTRTQDSRPIWSIWTSMDRDVHPPLYFLLARLWRDLFGAGETAMRSLSVVFALGAITVLFMAACQHIGVVGALWASAFMALAQGQVFYAREARGYTLLILLGMSACLAMTAIERRGPSRRRSIALGACALAMILTHYFSLGALMALGVYAVLRLRGGARRSALVALSAAAVGFALLWGPFLYQQRLNFGANVWLTSAGGPRAVLGYVGVLPLALLADPGHTAFFVTALAATLYVLPLVLLKRQPGLLMWYLWFVCTVALIAGMDLAHGRLEIAYARFTLLAAPGMFVTLAACAQATVRPWGSLLMFSALAMCVVSLPRAYERPMENWRELAELLERNVKEGEPIAIIAGDRGDWYSGTLLQGIRHYANPHGPMMIMTAPASPQVLARRKTGQSIWMVEGDCAESKERAFFPPNFRIVSSHLLLDIGHVYQLRPAEELQ